MIIRQRFQIQPNVFLHLILFKWITEKEPYFLPKTALLEDPLLCLVPLSKNQTIHLVDLLSMHDLSIEVRRVVSSSLLDKMKIHLLKHQKDYLHQIIKTKEPINFPRLQLDQWDGEKDTLRSILYHRGFNRLGKALYGSQRALYWHIIHKVDTGRAKIIEKILFRYNKRSNSSTFSKSSGFHSKKRCRGN